MTNKSYDEIRLQVVASQNLDKSGFNYHVEHGWRASTLEYINQCFYRINYPTAASSGRS